ncbi:PREDICTED: serine/threonine-protein phosphatase 7 long form homolog [Populus euphratica]|uniref:Serine/threonine-protein phosphatase 7 long form homolog n=1 Tax=Populus euphratica TaxID=75702 RepID=A0AAJ6SUL3_POPEU|nr:PREDICTED: serine/threonine-protein phosphatase 7 long form homolog [Populus euphratica]
MDTNPGPIDGCVLYDQDKHVSSAVWDGQERGVLRCHEHTSKLGEWKLSPKQIELVEKAGFGYLRKIPAISLYNPLISALVERWRRETNTFHLSVGEMTVTLQDVALLLGLAIDGKPVIGITHTSCASVCQRLLGKSPDSNYASGGMVKLSWLKEFFSHCSEDAPIEEVERCTRAYLLYLVGSTIFSTTTGNKVPVMYLPLFANFEEAEGFAWGAAALAFLYRALGNACVKSQSTICGCLTLLQCWSYFHLNVGRPKLNRDPIHDHFPFVLRWKGKQSGPTTNRDVVFYRKALDSLKPTDVEWLPYKIMDSTAIPKDIRNTLILGRSKTMLICFDKAERHLADRCLRQYGMLQPIPEDVERWLRKSRGVDGGVDLSGKMQSELKEWMDRQLHIVDGDDGVDEGGYMQWYWKITRKVVGRPISLSSEFQRTISGLREISYLADSFSTKGLDGQQFESISRIRFIAQDCLRDQIESPVTPSAPPQIELGKRSRGKERVRRKGNGKRRRKDEPMEYQEASEDDQLQFYGAVIVADQLHLDQADGEVVQLQSCQADDNFDPQHLSHAADEDYSEELQRMVNQEDDAKPSNATEDINESQPCKDANNENDSQSCHVTIEVNNRKIYGEASKGVDDSQSCEPTNKVNDSQICQETRSDVHDSQLLDASAKVNAS